MSQAAMVIDEQALQSVLAREHALAKGDDAKMADVRPQMAKAREAGASAHEVNALYPSDVYLSIEPDMGKFLYLCARAGRASLMVEFGTSFGISTLYLAAAAKETGGRVIASEREPDKAARARANFEEAGLAQWIDLREGDARETLSDIAAPIDLLFLDGWKDLYVPVLELMEPKLAAGAQVVADNIFTFPDALQSYVDRVNTPGGPYSSVVLPFTSGLCYSVFRTAD